MSDPRLTLVAKSVSRSSALMRSVTLPFFFPLPSMTPSISTDRKGERCQMLSTAAAIDSLCAPEMAEAVAGAAQLDSRVTAERAECRVTAMGSLVKLVMVLERQYDTTISTYRVLRA